MEMNNVLSKEVLKRLSKIQRLPEQGFLCGGAVANTILSIIDGKDYPINDLDIFLFEHVTTTSAAPLRAPINDIASDRYENRIIISSHKSNYRIIRTTNVDMINYVYVYFHDTDPIGLENKTKDQFNSILKSFDINCCKAGIDLSNGELYIDPEFNDFIVSRQLECVNPVTPAHTIIRLIKKRDDLGAYLNKEDQFKYLSQFFNYDLNVYYSKFNISIFFGKKYKEMFHKYENEITEYFELWSYGKTYRHNFTKKNLELLTTSNSNWWNYSPSINGVGEEHVHKIYEKKLWTLRPTVYSKLDEEISKYYIPESGTDPIIIKKLWELLYKTTKKQKNKIIKLLIKPELYPFVIVNDDFYNCDFNEVNIDRLVKFIQENPNFATLMKLTKLNFQESETLLYTIKNLFPLEIELFCDLISKEIEDEIYFKSDFNRRLILEKEYLTKKFNLIKSILSKDLTEKMDLSDFEYNSIIKELTSPLDLLWGGKFMHNCLKGYNENGFKNRIEKGDIKVFIISDNNERSALQISKSYSNTYRIDQIFGHSNTSVCTKHHMIAEYLINFLEYKHYLLESQKIIDKFNINRSNSIKLIEESNYEKLVLEGSLRAIGDIIPVPLELPDDFVDLRTEGFTIDGIRHDYEEIIINDEDEEESY
jgi:hypothetical protein